jgi:hypothetical protein
VASGDSKQGLGYAFSNEWMIKAHLQVGIFRADDGGQTGQHRETGFFEDAKSVFNFHARSGKLDVKGSLIVLLIIPH